MTQELIAKFKSTIEESDDLSDFSQYIAEILSAREGYGAMVLYTLRSVWERNLHKDNGFATMVNYTVANEGFFGATNPAYVKQLAKVVDVIFADVLVMARASVPYDDTNGKEVTIDRLLLKDEVLNTKCITKMYQFVGWYAETMNLEKYDHDTGMNIRRQLIAMFVDDKVSRDEVAEFKASVAVAGAEQQFAETPITVIENLPDEECVVVTIRASSEAFEMLDNFTTKKFGVSLAVVTRQ